MAIPNTAGFSSGDPKAQQAVQAAIAARSEGSQPIPQLSQTGQQPGIPPQALPSPQGQPVAPQPLPSPQGQIAQPGQGVNAPPKTEAEVIGRGLMQRLSAISKIETAGLETKSQPGPRIAPTS